MRYLLMMGCMLLLSSMLSAQKGSINKHAGSQAADSLQKGWGLLFGGARVEADTSERAGWSSYRAAVGDTAGMVQYGGRIYDPRIARYMPANKNEGAGSPYAYASKKPAAGKYKKPVKKAGG